MRWQLPVHSPVGLDTLAAGAWALASSHAATRARDGVVAALDAPRVVLTDSGTSALVLAFRALVAPGGAVALPAWGCIDLSAAAAFAGVRVRLYDLSPHTMSPDPDSLERALGRGVSAVLVAHFHGYPADVIGARAIAARHGVPLIEDAAQRAGGVLQGARLGLIGDVGVLSFGRGKGTTGGGGGALLVNDAALAGKFDDGAACLAGSGALRPVVATAAQWLLGRPALYGVPSSIPALRLGEMVYHPAREPAAIAGSSAAMVLRSLARDAGEVRLRRARASRLEARAARSGGLSAVRPVPGGESGFLRLAVRATHAGVRPEPRLGILRSYPMTLDEHEPLRASLLAGEAAGPGARALRDTLMTIPTHSRVSARDEDAIGRWMAACARAEARSPEVARA